MFVLPVPVVPVPVVVPEADFGRRRRQRDFRRVVGAPRPDGVVGSGLIVVGVPSAPGVLAVVPGSGVVATLGVVGVVATGACAIVITLGWIVCDRAW